MAKWLITGLAFALAAPASAAEEKPAREKMVCKKNKETTSRARSVRICMTKEEWERRAGDARDEINESRRHLNLEREGA